MAKNERFEKIYSQGTLTVTQIWVDKETGVNYLYHMDGYSGGLTDDSWDIRTAFLNYPDKVLVTPGQDS